MERELRELLTGIEGFYTADGFIDPQNG